MPSSSTLAKLRTTLALAALVPLASCLAWTSPRPDLVFDRKPPGVNFSTTPPGAAVILDGTDSGFATPCIIDLDEGERAMVGPLVAKRRRKAGKGVRASVTQRFDRHVLVVSDALFEPATGIEFGVGPAEAPVRFDVSLLVHELGHAVDFGPSRRAYAAWMEGGPGAKDARRCGAAWDEAGHQAAVLLGLDPTIGPSEYGAMMLEAGEPQEDFAESFMLFKLDPDFLREQSPVRFEWFDGGAHTRWPQRTDGPAEVCRPLPL